VTEDKSKTDTTKTKHNPEKANSTKHSKTKLAWFSRFFTTLGHETRWAYSTKLPSPHGTVNVNLNVCIAILTNTSKAV